MEAKTTRRQAMKSLLGAGSFVACSRLSLQAGAQSAASTPQERTRGEAPWLALPPTPSLPNPGRSGVISANGANVFYAQFGSGSPVLLLHGGLANSNYWGYQIEGLARRHSVIAMDTRGHGRSPVESDSFSYSIFAADVLSLMDRLQIDKVSVVGWSDGGITGLQLAMTAPTRIARLFAFGANASAQGLIANGSKSRVFTMFAERCRVEYLSQSPHPERWSRLLRDLSAMWRREPNFGMRDLGAIAVPTAISVGEYDEIIRRDHAEQMASAIPGARLVLQRGVSHFAMLQNPAQFNAALAEFLDQRS